MEDRVPAYLPATESGVSTDSQSDGDVSHGASVPGGLAAGGSGGETPFIESGPYARSPYEYGVGGMF